jgi:hypothetical protein
VHEWFELDAAPHVKNADPFRSIELVPRDREQADAEVRNVYWDFPERLGGVRVQ